MKYLKSLLKYIGIVVAIITLFVTIQLMLPQGNVKLTYDQSIVFVAMGVLSIAIGLKFVSEKES